MPPNTPRMRSGSLVKGLLGYLGFWTLYVFFFTSQNVTYAAFIGRAPRWRQAFVYPITDALVWAVLAPLVWMLASRFPLERPGLWRKVGLHLVAALVAAAASSALAVVILTGAGTIARPQLGEMFRGLVVGKLHANLLVYMAILVLSQLRRIDRRARDRQLHAARLESRLAEAQLLTLRAQLQPHFLFNTLHAIGTLMHRDVAAAEHMLVRLGDLLRNAMEHASTQEVTLREELEFLNAYLEIQQIRLGERLRASVTAEPGTLDALVPYLLLQPLVENAIRHAIAIRAEGGALEVRVARRGDALDLSVRDDGPGLPPGGITAGVGLENARVRLEHLYGRHQRMELTGPPGRGLVVNVTIPWRVAAAAGAAAS